MNLILRAARRVSAFALLLASAVACVQLPPPATVTTDPRPGHNIVLPEPANARLPSVFLIGDSTVRNGRDDGQNKGAEGQWGWGNPIAAMFDTSKVNLVNRAIGGLSSRTYLTAGHWERTLALVKPGDVVIMQFGHNDSGAVNDTSRARASLKGTGSETQEIDNLLTKKHELVQTYGWYLRKYIAETRAKGATPIVVSPIPRKRWDANGKIARGSGSHAAWAEQVAHQEHAGFLDLNQTVARKYDEMGREAVMKLFPQVTPDESVHTNWAGAELNARIVVAGLNALPNNPVRAWLRAPEDVRPVVDAAKVRDERPANPALPTLFLVGDSTVKSGGQNGAFGWGERIAPLFDTHKLNVVNAAIGGRSSRTFFTEGRWDKVLAQVKPGDFVLIQFGHNDGGRVGDPANKNRASGRGLGPETVEDIRADGSKEAVHTFGWYLAHYVASARARGAIVVIASPIPHRDQWEQGRDFASIAEWAAEVARAGGAHYIDLTMLISDAYRSAGAPTVNTFFSDARTHTNNAGARFNAARVVVGLKGLPGNPLGAYFAPAR